MRLKSCSFTFLLGVIIFLGSSLLAATARAQLVLTLTPSLITATAGSTVTYTAIIENQSTTQGYYLNNLKFDFAVPIESVDPFSFFDYFQATYPTGLLPANATYVGNLVDVNVLGTALPGDTSSGTIVLEGGLTTSELSSLAQVEYTISVGAAAVPELSSLTLMGVVASVLVMIGVGRLPARRRPIHIFALVRQVGKVG